MNMLVGANVPFSEYPNEQLQWNLEGTCILEPAQSVTQIGYSNKFANANRRHALLLFKVDQALVRTIPSSW